MFKIIISRPIGSADRGSEHPIAKAIMDYAQLMEVETVEPVDFVAAAGIGCRVTTAWRAVVDRGRVQPGEWLVVHGSGGVGLSALMLAKALGARTVAVDVSADALRFAEALGADELLDVSSMESAVDVGRAVREDGVHVWCAVRLRVDSRAVRAAPANALHVRVIEVFVQPAVAAIGPACARTRLWLRDRRPRHRQNSRRRFCRHVRPHAICVRLSSLSAV